ncbi:MAG: hypothetical protein AAGI66_01740 [Cyanobacteria bacterium P01_H01_bin.74]
MTPATPITAVLQEHLQGPDLQEPKRSVPTDSECELINQSGRQLSQPQSGVSHLLSQPQPLKSLALQLFKQFLKENNEAALKQIANVLRQTVKTNAKLGDLFAALAQNIENPFIKISQLYPREVFAQILNPGSSSTVLIETLQRLLIKGSQKNLCIPKQPTYDPTSCHGQSLDDFDVLSDQAESNPENTPSESPTFLFPLDISF